MTSHASHFPSRFPIDRLKRVDESDVRCPANRRRALDVLADCLIWLAPLENGPTDDLKRHLMSRVRAAEHPALRSESFKFSR